jgi:predicted O-methyltransferase YrrM
MDSKALHAAIRKKFHLSNLTTRMANLPYCAGMRYNRVHLAELLGENGFNRGAEIGVRSGGYSLRICACNPNIELYCIDPWSVIGTKYTEERQAALYEVTKKKLAKHNATLIRKTSMEAVVDFEDRSLDFVYIDGDHRFDSVVMDIVLWSKKVRSGGIVAAHDCYGGEVGVQKAVEAYVHCHHIDPWYVTKELAPTAFWVNP